MTESSRPCPLHGRPVIFLCCSGGQGGAEKQLANLATKLSENTEVHLFLLSAISSYEELLSSRIHIHNFPPFSLSFRYVQNLFSCLDKICSNSEGHCIPVIQAWLPKANLILLLYVLFSRSSFQPFLAHRSDFFVYDNVPSTLLRLSLFLISPFSY